MTMHDVTPTRASAPGNRVISVDLDTVPRVDALLDRAGLGVFDRETVTSPIGRNTSWRGRTTSGRDVFVKHLTGHGADRRYRRSVGFETFVAAQSAGAIASPALLASEEESCLLVFELVTDTTTGGDLMVAEAFTEQHAGDLGTMLGELHEGKAPAGLVMDDSPPSLPPLGYFEGLSLDTYLEASAAELEAWQLLQDDDELIAALRRLREWESAAEGRPSHGDFRVDQVLFHEDRPYLADWEEFRLADPARDVGAFVGEWLFRAMLDLVTNRGDSDFVDLEFTHELVIERGTAKLERLLPLISAFLTSYFRRRGEIDADFSTRATGFAGWHLIDRLIAGAASSHRLTGVQRASAGVGRNAVLFPDRFSQIFGFEEAAA